MKIPVLNQKGEKASEMAQPAFLTVKVCDKLVTQYVNYLRAALRSSIASTKDRGAVSGGGRKPWKQKGTGNARVGSTRSPLWVGGGVTFGPSPDRNYTLRMNKKERRQVILSVFSDALAGKKLIVLDNLIIPETKTKAAYEVISDLNLEGKIAVILPLESAESVWLSFRNLQGVSLMTPERLDFLFLLSANKIVVTKVVLEKIGQTYGANLPKEEVELTPKTVKTATEPKKEQE